MTDAALSAPWRLGIHVAQWMILPNVEDLETHARQDVEMEPRLHLKNVMMATQPEVMDVAAHVWSNVGGYAVQTWGALLELVGTVKLQEPKSVTTATVLTVMDARVLARRRRGFHVPILEFQNTPAVPQTFVCLCVEMDCW